MQIPDEIARREQIKRVYSRAYDETFAAVPAGTDRGVLIEAGVLAVAEWARKEAATAILDIHREHHGENEHGLYTVCRGCSASPYPCDTVKAIRALTGDE
ncbi:hypothetical protein ACFVU2_21000 [Leifsonia sp. NPDC058194]|uniref:hypothetical protein n=1 Tax=Leifsonia sp. NPDC058194 TaxID=3346374 RepID=UPI0036DCF16B